MIELIEHLHWGALFQIVLIDILLGGDNAVVIALACRKLDHKRRLQGILWGTFGAILMRVILIVFAMSLLEVPYLRIVGAVLLFWIGIKLMLPEPEHHEEIRGTNSIFQAVKTIIIADFVMSLDNVIAIAAAAKNALPDHQIAYVIFGLLLSVPIIIWGSTLVLKLIDKFPLVIIIGAGLLGWIAGGMLFTDVAFHSWFLTLGDYAKPAIEISAAILLVLCGKLWPKLTRKKRLKT